jgi:hypothetical protein
MRRWVSGICPIRSRWATLGSGFPDRVFKPCSGFWGQRSRRQYGLCGPGFGLRAIFARDCRPCRLRSGSAMVKLQGDRESESESRYDGPLEGRTTAARGLAPIERRPGTAASGPTIVAGAIAAGACAGAYRSERSLGVLSGKIAKGAVMTGRRSEIREPKKPPVRFGQPISKGSRVYSLGPIKPKTKPKGKSK